LTIVRFCQKHRLSKYFWIYLVKRY